MIYNIINIRCMTGNIFINTDIFEILASFCIWSCLEIIEVPIPTLLKI